MKKVGFITALFAFVIVSVIWLAKDDGVAIESDKRLVVHCAAGLRLPVEEIVAQYKREYGVDVQLNYGGSGELYGKLKIAGGDLYIPADVSYTEKGQAEGIVDKSIPFGKLTAGIMVKKGNPLNIRSLADLTRMEVRVSLAEKSAAVGKFAHETLQSADVLDGIHQGTYSTSLTVNSVANQVKLDAADAGIVWDALMAQYPDHLFIEVPEFSSEQKLATIAVLKSSTDATAAMHFARYLTASDRGLKLFEKHGVKVMKGDGWSQGAKIE